MSSNFPIITEEMQKPSFVSAEEMERWAIRPQIPDIILSEEWPLATGHEHLECDGSTNVHDCEYAIRCTTTSAPESETWTVLYYQSIWAKWGGVWGWLMSGAHSTGTFPAGSKWGQFPYPPQVLYPTQQVSGVQIDYTAVYEEDAYNRVFNPETNEYSLGVVADVYWGGEHYARHHRYGKKGCKKGIYCVWNQ